MASGVAEHLAETQHAVNEQAQKYGLKSIAIHIEAQRSGITGTVATGVADLDTKRVLTGTEPTRMASMTKTYTAACILRLMELGKLDIANSVDQYLLPDTREILQRAGYDLLPVSVEHVLNHTSGIPEYADGEYQTLLFKDPLHRWTRQEQILRAAKMRPVGSPGEHFSYSDTGYILLGETIEHITRLPQAQAFRQLLSFDRLGLKHTWFESLESPPPDLPERAHQYFGETDATGLDPSFDLWGGGGLMATMDDEAIFLRALMTGKVFEYESTLANMLRIPDTNHELGYGLGVFRTMIKDEDETIEFWGHSGFWGTYFYYSKDLDLTFVENIYQGRKPEGFDPCELLRRAVQMNRRALISS